MGVGDVDGIVEMDETFVAESFKGNHKKSGFEMPRPARKRGKQVKKRGISNEQVCIATAIDRNENIISFRYCLISLCLLVLYVKIILKDYEVGDYE